MLKLQSQSAKPQTFEIKDGEFLYNSQPIKIYSGEMHYSRIPQEYWRNRLKMVKAMGLNTVATCVFWNYHNTAPGVWDFKTDNRNLGEYIRLAQEEGLFVILRPGPYVCAEWEFGGYPWWLQQNKDLEVRTNNPAFLDSCRVYFSKLAKQVKELQVSRGGPVIMVQVENEFGSYVSQRTDIPSSEHQAYYNSIHNMLTEVGFEVPFFTSDGTWLFDGGAIRGVLPTANGEGNIENLKKSIDKYYPGGPYMVAEYYPGWLDHWGEDFVRISPEENLNQVRKYLENGINFNFYMVHGGTNFGFTSGANYNDASDIQPDLTSYDYDAPISEAGWANPKYNLLREEFLKYVNYTVPAVPEQIPVIAIPDIKLEKTADFFEWKKQIKPVGNDTPLTFEQLGQGYGYVLYSKRFNQPIKGKMKIHGLRDFAIVFIDGKKVGELNRMFNQYEIEVNISFNGRLDILVENMGRINYGAEIPNNKKGIISPVTINDFEISGNWEMYKIPMDNAPDITAISKSAQAGRPAIYAGSFNIEKPGDVFLDMHGWGKGIVFVNGHNLGRYWKIGPQQTLYLPGCWIKKGKNEVTIFEQQNEIVYNLLKTTDKPILDELK
jgi:beta-galactosidase